MLNGSLHPQLLIGFLATLGMSAAWEARAVTLAPESAIPLQAVLFDKGQGVGPSPEWLGAAFEKLVVTGDFAELKDNDDDERNEARKHVPHDLLSDSCHTAVLPRSPALIASDFGPRDHPPGARRGPPPRMPPL